MCAGGSEIFKKCKLRRDLAGGIVKFGKKIKKMVEYLGEWAYNSLAFPGTFHTTEASTCVRMGSL